MVDACVNVVNAGLNRLSFLGAEGIFADMAKSSFENARISGVVSCVPRGEKSIDDAVELFGGNVQQIERIKKTIGLDKRRVVEGTTTAADLCYSAARDLMERAKLAPQAVDALICVTQTPDYGQPCNAAVLHGRLGLGSDCAALDVNLGCSGYVYGLWLAHMMVNSGGCQRVLLLAGDTISRITNPRDRAVAPLFGDGGSATLIEHCTEPSPAWFSLHTDGSGYENLIVPAGAFRCPSSEETRVERIDAEGNVRSAENLSMDGAEVFNFSIRVEPASVREVAEYAGLALGEIDYFVFHQANRYILSNIAKRLKLDPDCVPMRSVERFGNQSSASIPVAICDELDGELGSREKRLLLSGFGVGLSWASAIVNCGPLMACALIEYES
tara:strand:- start:5476 stop:6630 length:1155 start_codon:yes stop_codon:yes gene_type:complete